MGPESIFLITAPAGFETEARREVEAIIPGSRARGLFFKGNLIVECLCHESEAIAKLKENSTKYVGRVVPVDLRLKISSHKESIRRLCEDVRLLCKLGKGDTFVVRCRRRGSHEFSSLEVEREIGSCLERATEAVADLGNPGKVVSVHIFQNLVFIGVTEPRNILVKTVGVSRKYEKGKRPLTRAEHKIKEAIEAFSLSIRDDDEVLDLGAAPGGWTKVLSGLAGKIVAVDPADLDPAVASLRNVVHLKCRAEEVSAEVGMFDLITNDMNLDPAESARLMASLAHHLRRDGAAVMTVKFVTRNRQRHIEEAIEVLKSRFKDFSVVKLPHNRFETTLFMRKA